MNIVDADDAVDDGIDGQAGSGVDVEFAGDVAAVSHDRIYRNKHLFGNLLVRQAHGHQSDNLALAVAQQSGCLVARLRARGLFVLVVGGELRAFLQSANAFCKQGILHVAVVEEILLHHVDVHQRVAEQGCVLVVGIIFNDDVLQLKIELRTLFARV